MPRQQRPSNSILRFSGMAFQMGITIGLFVYGGIKLDAYMQLETPIWTLVGSILGVTIAITVVIRQVLRG